MVACFFRGGSRLSRSGRRYRENKFGDDGRISERRADIRSAKNNLCCLSQYLQLRCGVLPRYVWLCRYWGPDFWKRVLGATARSRHPLEEGDSCLFRYL